MEESENTIVASFGSGKGNTLTIKLAKGDKIEQGLLQGRYKSDAKKIHTAINTVFKDVKFDKLRLLIIRGIKNHFLK